MSTHGVDVVAVHLEPHPNADSLSLVHVNGFTVAVRTQDWTEGQLAAYVEPDYLVPADNPVFAFMSAFSKPITQQQMIGYRVKCKRLRGVMSMGLLVPAPAGAGVGDNVIDALGIKRYEPPQDIECGGDNCGAPAGVYYKYDIESGYRYPNLFEIGEDVVITEKIHGASARFVYIPGQGQYCSSHTCWKKETESNLWWRALRDTPQMLDFCHNNPGHTVYAEVYGQVQSLKYGFGKGEVAAVAFDILYNGEWMPWSDTVIFSLPWVPVLYRGPWSPDLVSKFVDGDSVLADYRGAKHMREGIVIRAVAAKWKGNKPDPTYPDRRQLKFVSSAYLEKE